MLRPIFLFVLVGWDLLDATRGYTGFASCFFRDADLATLHLQVRLIFISLYMLNSRFNARNVTTLLMILVVGMFAKLWQSFLGRIADDDVVVRWIFSHLVELARLAV